MNATTKTSPPPMTEAEARRPTSQELSDLDKARAELDRAKNDGNRKIALEKVDKIERTIRNRADSAWRSAASVETVALARGRGEAVETEGGSVRVSSRDGLHALRKAGHITEAQYAVGMLYRAGHEARGRDMKVQDFGGGAGGGHDNDLFVATRIERARMLQFTAQTDRAVACACISHPSALQMLRSVAGEGNSLSTWGEGRALARNREGLTEALDIAQGVMRTMAQERASRTPGATTS